MAVKMKATIGVVAILLHNVHAWAEKNRPFNFGQPVQGLERTG